MPPIAGQPDPSVTIDHGMRRVIARFGLVALLIWSPTARADEAALVDALLDLPAPYRDWRSTPAARPRPFDAASTDDELLDVYGQADSSSDLPMPDAKVRQMLLEAGLRRPAALELIARFLPETKEAGDRLKAVYDRAPAGERDARWRVAARRFLLTHSLHFRAELIAAAAAFPDSDDPSYLGGRDGSALAALARLDWAAAEPILRRHVDGKDRTLSARAVAIAYEHATAAPDRAAAAAEAEAIRGRFKAIVADRGAPDVARAVACRALLSSQWPGRDDYYLSLFADPTLRELHADGWTIEPLNDMVLFDPDRWVPLVARFVGGKDRAAHDAAVGALAQFHPRFARADALRPLIPWLADPDWSSAGGRSRLIKGLAYVTIPESVPGLSKVAVDEADSRLDAFAALARHHAKGDQIGRAMREALAAEPGHDHPEIVSAMLACGVLTEAEIVAALEARARHDAKPREPGKPETPWPPDIDLGVWVQHKSEPGPGDVAGRVLARADALAAAGELPVAAKLRESVQRWPDAAVDLDFARRIAAGLADATEVQRAAGRAELLRNNAATPLRALAGKGGVRGGLAAGLLGDAAADDLLNGNDAAAQIAMLATARLARTPLPVTTVAGLMAGADRRLARAAELYLIGEDGPEARRLVLARHPGEAMILDPTGRPSAAAERLRREVLAGAGGGGVDEVFALLNAGGGGEPGVIVRARRAGAGGAEAATLTVDLGQGKTRVRDLRPDELRQVRAFVADRHVDDLAPLTNTVFDGSRYEYLHLTRDGGRSVFLDNPDANDSVGTVYDRLTRFFLEFQSGGPTRVEYAALNGLPGAGVVLSDEDAPIAAAWKGGDGLRVLRGGQWYAVRDGQAAAKADPPPGWATGRADAGLPPGLAVEPGRQSSLWRRTAGPDSFWLVESYKEQGGLWRWRQGEPPKQITRGRQWLVDPVPTPDGRWVVVADLHGSYDAARTLVRVRVSDGKQHPCDLPAEFSFDVVGYVGEHGQFLACGRKKAAKDRAFETRFWLVEPATGAAREVRGEFGPLFDRRDRPLQPAAALARPGGPDPAARFWATTRDDGGTRIGLYDARTFTFTPVVTVPGLQFASTDLWVDEAAAGPAAAGGRPGGVAYVTVNGDLLRIPLPR